MKSLHSQYPDITYLYSIGKSVQRRDLLVLAISTDPSQHTPGKPEFKFIGNIHGNEVTGRELLLNLAESLLMNYGRNIYLTKIVNMTRIHILPSMNPDGHKRAIEGDYNGVKGRFNTNGVDLNRNFPHGRSHGNHLGRRIQPETFAVIQWSIPFVLSASLHDGSLLVNFPYDDYINERRFTSHTGDHELFIRLAYSYARAHEFMWKKGPRCLYDFYDDPQLGITNGAEWYPVAGGMQDWNYLNTNCFEVTIEMNCQKYTFENRLQKLWNEHKFAMIGFISQVHNTIHGFITDSVTGEGIGNVEIRITNEAKVIKSSKYGDYWRLINPGLYQMTFQRPFYKTERKIIEIKNEQSSLFLNISLQRLNRRFQNADQNALNLRSAVPKSTISIIVPFSIVLSYHSIFRILNLLME
ncbi:unnamed protein product [Dracunculus medinensis]|uniref:Peptidase M14 domain-containing protein n=1 Tax=Dracunculus medinensis TaxID=318479 RepID=A0A3P7PUV7_DRAME|nr:unnamed protein product [Dracunculus medinensis]